jgi:copper chaperone
MERSIFNVDGMSCQHCVKAVTDAVSALPGVTEVAVDLERKTVTVDHDPSRSTADKIRFEIEEQGYDVME